MLIRALRRFLRHRRTHSTLCLVLAASALAGPTVRVSITGMTCAACAARVQRKLSRGDGVRDAVVNFGTERATVTYDPSSADAVSLVDLVRAAGLAEDSLDINQFDIISGLVIIFFRDYGIFVI